MVGGIKLSSPGKKSMSEGMFLDVPTMSAPSGKDAEQLHPHRSSALDYASAARDVHSRVYGACTAEAAASETSGLSVGGCPERWRYFRPYPVFTAVRRAQDAPGPAARARQQAGDV